MRPMPSPWRSVRPAALSLALLLVLGSPTAHPTALREDDIPAAAAAAIRAANADWLPALKRADAAALAAPYAEEALFITPGGEVLRGRGAVQQLYTQRIANIASVVKGELVHEGSARVSDTLVYEWGRGTLTVQKRGGTQSTGGGPYLTVWRRGAEGRWQIIRNLAF